jgi:hypothetical protein
LTRKLSVSFVRFFVRRSRVTLHCTILKIFTKAGHCFLSHDKSYLYVCSRKRNRSPVYSDEGRQHSEVSGDGSVSQRCDFIPKLWLSKRTKSPANLLLHLKPPTALYSRTCNSTAHNPSCEGLQEIKVRNELQTLLWSREITLCATLKNNCLSLSPALY